jgi:hypothetical protein
MDVRENSIIVEQTFEGKWLELAGVIDHFSTYLMLKAPKDYFINQNESSQTL